jgi:hypothetical protein
MTSAGIFGMQMMHVFATQNHAGWQHNIRGIRNERKSLIRWSLTINPHSAH